MKTYLTRWNESGETHSAMFTIQGIHRLVSRLYGKARLQVAIYNVSNDIFIPPTPLRMFYDWKFDKLSLFSLSGDLVEMSERGITTKGAA